MVVIFFVPPFLNLEQFPDCIRLDKLCQDLLNISPGLAYGLFHVPLPRAAVPRMALDPNGETALGRCTRPTDLFTVMKGDPSQEACLVVGTIPEDGHCGCLLKEQGSG
jgi:hypothetical protein